MFAGAAISRGRIFFVLSDAIYAIGPKQRKTLTGWAADEPAVTGEGAPAYVQVSPTELVLEPGRTVKLSARSSTRAGGSCARRKPRGRSRASRARSPTAT